LGDAWTLRILQDAFRGVRNFSEWQRTFGISKGVLANRLARLVEAGVFVKNANRPGMWIEYRLTEKGLDLWSVLLSIWAWQRKWEPDPKEQRSRLVHLNCGKSIRPICSCSHCRRELTAFSTRPEPGRGAGSDDRLPARYLRQSIVVRHSKDESGINTDAAKVFGDRWTSQLVGGAFLGLRRFSDFEKKLGISPYILADRLEELLQLGVFECRAAQPGMLRRTYHLTQKGLDTYPVILQFLRWGDRWLAGDAGPPLYVIHIPCGHAVEPILTRSHCGQDLERKTVRLY